MTLGEKVEWLAERGSEIAFGYNDSGCFWHMRLGMRGAGNMIGDIGERYEALDADTFEEAVDEFIRQVTLDAAK